MPSIQAIPIYRQSFRCARKSSYRQRATLVCSEKKIPSACHYNVYVLCYVVFFYPLLQFAPSVVSHVAKCIEAILTVILSIIWPADFSTNSIILISSVIPLCH